MFEVQGKKIIRPCVVMLIVMDVRGILEDSATINMLNLGCATPHKYARNDMLLLWCCYALLFHGNRQLMMGPELVSNITIFTHSVRCIS
jgi:hypothetical protein